MNRSVGTWRLQPLGRTSARFIVVPAAYALALGPGAAGQRGALAVFVRSAGAWARPCVSTCSTWPWPTCSFTLTRRCGSPTPGPGPLALPGGRLPRSRGRLLCVHLRAVAFAALISVCRCSLVHRPGPRRPPAPALRAAAPPRARVRAAWLAGLACAHLAAPARAAPRRAALPRLERGWARRRPGLHHRGLHRRLLLVLAAYVSLRGRALASARPSPRRARAPAQGQDHGVGASAGLRPLPGALPSAAGAWVTGQEAAASREGGGMPGHLHARRPTHLSLALLSLNSCLDPLIYCFGKHARSGLLGAGAAVWGGGHLGRTALLGLFLEGSLARCLLHPLAPSPAGVLGGGSSLQGRGFHRHSHILAACNCRPPGSAKRGKTFL